MIKTFIFLLSFSFLTPCLASLEAYKTFLKDIKTRLNHRDICPVLLENWKNESSTLAQNLSVTHNFKLDGPQLLDQSFQTRLALHDRLASFSNHCKKQVMGLFTKMREVEDWIGLSLYPQMFISDLDYTKVNAPIFNHSGYPAFHLNPQFKNFKFEEGDLMITKGISVISSTITSFTDYGSPFSHIAFVHINPKTHLPETIESYIGKGVSYFTMDEALKNENSRILILRPKDQKMAKAAALYMRERINLVHAQGHYIAYDYDLDFTHNSTLSCEEVAYDAYKTASQGSVLIPEVSSVLNIKGGDIQYRLGMKNGPLMMPADMEIDSRFDIVLDWTDYRIIRDSWRKDAMMKTMLTAVEEGKYVIPETLASRLVPTLWKTRNISWLWPLVSKVTGLPKDFTPDVPPQNIATRQSFIEVQNIFLSPLQKLDQAAFASEKNWPPKSFLITKMLSLMQEKK